MKHLFSLLLTISALFALSACSRKTETIDPASIDVSTLPLNIDVQTASALSSRDDVLLLDVREQSEYDAGHIPGVTLIPMNDVPNRLAEIPTDKTVIVTCRSGNRSGQVTEYLRGQGFSNVYNMAGGIVEWQNAGLPVEK